MKSILFVLTLLVLFASADVFGQRMRSSMIRFYEDYVKADLESETYGGLDSFTLTADMDVDGDIALSDLLTMELHTVVEGDSALGNIFLDAADTTLKMGTGSDLVTIVDGAP